MRPYQGSHVKGAVGTVFRHFFSPSRGGGGATPVHNKAEAQASPPRRVAQPRAMATMLRARRPVTTATDRTWKRFIVGLALEDIGVQYGSRRGSIVPFAASTGCSGFGRE